MKASSFILYEIVQVYQEITNINSTKTGTFVNCISKSATVPVIHLSEYNCSENNTRNRSNNEYSETPSYCSINNEIRPTPIVINNHVLK